MCYLWLSVAECRLLMTQKCKTFFHKLRELQTTPTYGSFRGGFGGEESAIYSIRIYGSYPSPNVSSFPLFTFYKAHVFVANWIILFLSKYNPGLWKNFTWRIPVKNIWCSFQSFFPFKEKYICWHIESGLLMNVRPFALLVISHQHHLFILSAIY